METSYLNGYSEILSEATNQNKNDKSVIEPKVSQGADKLETYNDE